MCFLNCALEASQLSWDAVRRLLLFVKTCSSSPHKRLQRCTDSVQSWTTGVCVWKRTSRKQRNKDAAPSCTYAHKGGTISHRCFKPFDRGYIAYRTCLSTCCEFSFPQLSMTYFLFPPMKSDRVRSQHSECIWTVVLTRSMGYTHTALSLSAFH